MTDTAGPLLLPGCAVEETEPGVPHTPHPALSQAGWPADEIPAFDKRACLPPLFVPGGDTASTTVTPPGTPIVVAAWFDGHGHSKYSAGSSLLSPGRPSGLFVTPGRVPTAAPLRSAKHPTRHCLRQRRRRAPLNWQCLGGLPAPAIVVLASYVLATTGDPRCSMVALTTHFAGLVAVAAFSLRIAA
jgi:hypothetical protein